MLQVLQAIRETDPPRPSLRLSESADAIDGISLQRKTEPKRLHQLVRGDLDWIVMKALDKDRARRYPTAVSMAEDIERYLNSQPIVARPPSASYLIGKFFVKHRNACFAGIAMVTLLLFGLIGTSVGLWRAEKERKDAQEAKLLADQAKHFAIQSGMREGQQRIEAEKNAARALTAEKMAEDRADDLQRFVELQSLQLASINVNQMAQQLEASLAKQLGGEGDSKADSQAKAELDQLALQLKQLNYVDVSRSVLQKSVFDPYIDTIEAKYLDQPELAISALSAIGQLENDLGLHQASLRPVRLAVELAQKQMGQDHPTTLRLMSEQGLYLSAAGLRQDSETLCREVLTRRRKVLGETHLDTLHSMNNLAGLLLERGELDEAEKLFSETLAARKKTLGDDHADTIMSLNNMGGMMQMRGKFAEAETYYRPALEARRRLLGSEHYETLMSINNLGFVARKQSRWAEAEQLFREGMETSRRVLGNEHPMTAYFASNMGFLLRDQKRLQDAEPYFREAFELRQRVLGETHPDTIIAMNNLASLYESLERFEQAESLYRTALQVALERTGEGHPNTITYQQNLAALLLKQDKWEEAYRLLEAAYQARVTLAGEFDLQAVELLVGLVSIDRKLERESEFTAKVQGVVDHFAGEEGNPAIDRLRKYVR
jgi:eukaryotic-like serine/threonine-protein kinase